MKNEKTLSKIKRAFALFFMAVLFACSILFVGGRCEMNSLSAQAYAYDLIEIRAYDLDMNVRKDRKIEVKEKITVKFLENGLSMFYRSLPIEGAQYSSITATCPGNDAFYYYVEDNPDDYSYIDINCVGNTNRGQVWTYELSYVMEQGVDFQKDGMIIDVVGFGWTVPLHNVTAKITFPAQAVECEIYTDNFGEQNSNWVTWSLSENKMVVTMSADTLNRVYSSKYDEYVTGGITLDFTLEEGGLENYLSTKIFGEDVWKFVLGALGAIGLSFVLLVFTSKRREIVTVVNIKAPDEMDPLKMGKWLDGAVDNEDITSMIYYFANKGYLSIDFSDEDDPLLKRKRSSLPAFAPEYERTLFKGLFKGAEKRERDCVVRVSKAAGDFYDAMQMAKLQTPKPPTMYELKSIFGFIGGGVIGVVFALITAFLSGQRLHQGYSYPIGLAFVLPVLGILLMSYFTENYRYKWKNKAKVGMLLGEIAIALLFSFVNYFLFGDHVFTGFEKMLLFIGALAPIFITKGALTRTEEYTETLGNILGFKDFIVVTEEDKIKFMLEDSPELYYKI